jgi:hypothetical protein
MSLEHLPLEEPEVAEVVLRRTEQEFGSLGDNSNAASRRTNWTWGFAVGASLLLAIAVMALRPVAFTERLDTAPAGLTAVVPTTVPVGSVSYGPDIWKEGTIDPSFRPGGPLPQGLAITATVGNVLWGCGDRKAAGAQPPEGATAKQIEERLQELVVYVRDQVTSRNLPVPDANVPKEFQTALPSIPVMLGLEWRNGGGGTTIAIPTGHDAHAEAELRRIVHLAAKQMTDQTADSIQWIRGNDPNLP